MRYNNYNLTVYRGHVFALHVNTLMYVIYKVHREPTHRIGIHAVQAGENALHIYYTIINIIIYKLYKATRVLAITII